MFDHVAYTDPDDRKASIPHRDVVACAHVTASNAVGLSGTRGMPCRDH
jgi:hypothetical protein